MILVDANILLYAYVPSSKFHEAARMWLETTFSKREPVSLSWVVILAFLHHRQGFRTFSRSPVFKSAGSQVPKSLTARKFVIPGSSLPTRSIRDSAHSQQTFFHIELRSRFKTQRILRRALVSSPVGVRFWDHRVRT